MDQANREKMEMQKQMATLTTQLAALMKATGATAPTVAPDNMMSWTAMDELGESIEVAMDEFEELTSNMSL